VRIRTNALSGSWAPEPQHERRRGPEFESEDSSRGQVAMGRSLTVRMRCNGRPECTALRSIAERDECAKSGRCAQDVEIEVNRSECSRGPNAAPRSFLVAGFPLHRNGQAVVEADLRLDAEVAQPAIGFE
jgi:hypothetical protein